ncbi:hypothetical protein LMH87_003315 [Akanthomyces muscarius]|uniref:Heterokaryon incompatibility domain-containing protein n=3 Tax=Akanthomyces muscarius TaxID=2231603 RepID=A0A9W8UGG9_AKAMU|nr:hypothetical protein LMH87_003315 [Akanthomyces muscarius]KAJ4144433.1 hypothetical protein LMH87_003315 [Akanthomyces muscarius]
MSSREASPSARFQFFANPPWLGFPHDGYDVVPLAQYIDIRPQDTFPNWEEEEEMAPRKLAASIQSLLTFGLLEAVTEQHVPESKLILAEESGRLVMSRDGLLDVLLDWVWRVRMSREEDLTPWFDRVIANLSHAHSSMVIYMRSTFQIFSPLGDDAPAMACFIASVGEALATARMCFREPSQGWSGFSWTVWIPPWRSSLEEQMITEGWCPSVVEYLISSATVSSLEYVRKCGPVKDGKCHDTCSSLVCATDIVDENTYSQKHASSCNSSGDPPCVYTTPPLGDVLQLLIEREVPVVTFADGLDADPSCIQVHKASDVPYVAISHVWADGLGSTTETGLPTCQLRRLASLVSTVQPGAAIWIDSLCVPKTDRERKTAIELMARTYSQAAAVLVLDDGLQRCPAAAPPGVKVLRVLTSGWMRRLWTLQEATLSRALYLAFADATLVPLAELIPPGSIILTRSHHADLAKELFRLTKLSAFQEYSIGDVARSLQWRTTNRSSDETLAIASLLGADVSALTGLAQQDRMMRLLQNIGRFPRNILLLDGGKLECPGFRWAPRSFMTAHGGRSSGPQLSTQTLDAQVTSSGLEARCYVLLFRMKTFERRQAWTLKDRKSGRDYLMVGPLSGPSSYTCDMVLLPETLRGGNTAHCVAGLLDMEAAKKQTRSSFTVHCEYRMRLLMTDVLGKEEAGEVVVGDVSGWATVCVS